MEAPAGSGGFFYARKETSVATSKLPASWSNKNKIEWLERGAYEALSRALNRAVADTGTNFSVWSAGRSKAEQVALFKQNYAPAGRGRKLKSDRSYAGKIWARKPGGVNVASPDLGSNHEDGRAVDIHPAAIQNWFKSNGRLYGWSWDEGKRVGENWHFRYVPSLDQMKHEGLLDHAAVQRVVGATVDGKIGTGTVAKIKSWQKAHGLTADGKVGAGTKRAMGLAGKGDAAPAVPVAPGGGTSVPAPSTGYTIERHQTKNLRPDRVDEKRGLVGELNAITLHHWGSDGQDFDNVVSWLVADGNGNNQSSAHEVIEGGRVAILADMKDGTWNSGSAQGNVDNYALECRPEADPETVATVAARVAAIREEAGKDLPLNIHSDYTATQCPGRYRDLLGEIDALARGGTVNLGRPITPSKPVSSGKLPTGKALLMAIIDAPDFPLLRTPGNLCYYGGDSKQTAVSGKMPNSLVPGEITGSGAKSGAEGLKTWQAQMNARGYSLTVDGRYGDATEKAAKNLQRLAGLATDGKIGPSTFYAAWLLPVVS